MALSIETKAGKPVFAGGIKIVPFARSVRWQVSRIPAGFIWNRAVAVLAIYPDGREEVIPVRDNTRRIELTLFGFVALWVLFSLLFKSQDFPERRRTDGR